MPARTCFNCMFQNGPLDKYCACCGEKLISIPRKRRNRELNPRPLHYKCNALPIELSRHNNFS